MNNYIGVCTRTKEADEFPFHPISFIYQTRSNEWTNIIVVSTVSISHSLLTKCRHSIKLHHQRFSLYSKMFTSNINRNRIDSFFSRVLIIAQLSWANAAPGSYRWVIFKQKSQQEKKVFFTIFFSASQPERRELAACVYTTFTTWDGSVKITRNVDQQQKFMKHFASVNAVSNFHQLMTTTLIRLYPFTLLPSC